MSLDDGAAGDRGATQFHPKSYAGQRMWGDTTAALRVYLEPFGEEVPPVPARAHDEP